MKVAGACLLGLGIFLARTAASAQAADSVPPAVNLTQLSQTLSQIEQSAQQTSMDLGRLRIDKWKTGSDNKRQSQADADSVRTNMTAALPTMTAAVRATPTAMAPTLKLYRDLNLLYDILASLTESTGAFGAKDDFNALAQDQQTLDTARRQLADYVENLAAFKDSELVRLRTQAAAAQANVPRKVIDDNEPVKKPAKKKAAKPTTKPPAAQPAQPQ
jgi:hypothetical protein